MTLHRERSFYHMSTHAHTVCLKAVQAYDTVVHRLQRANRTADEVAVHRAADTRRKRVPRHKGVLRPGPKEPPIAGVTQGI